MSIVLPFFLNTVILCFHLWLIWLCKILDSSFLRLWSLLYFDKIMLLSIIYYASVCKFMLSEKLRWIKCLISYAEMRRQTKQEGKSYQLRKFANFCILFILLFYVIQ